MVHRKNLRILGAEPNPHARQHPLFRDNVGEAFADPRDREIEAAKAHERALKRFGTV